MIEGLKRVQQGVRNGGGRGRNKGTKGCAIEEANREEKFFARECVISITDY